MLVTVACFVALNAQAGEKAEYRRATEIQVANNSATMFYQDDGWLTSTTGPVGSDGIPKTIKLGDTIRVKDKALVAKHIVVTYILEDMEWGGQVLAKKGDITCVIAESEKDFPGDVAADRLWINVKECKPIH